MNPNVPINRKKTPILLPLAFLGLITAKMIGIIIPMVVAIILASTDLNIHVATESSINSAWNTITSIVHF
jgi:hypothetical protein